VWTLLVGLIAVTLLSGCTLFDLAKVRETERMDARYARVSGTLSPGPVAADWMVVFWFEVPCDADWAALREAVAHGRLAGPPGAWRDEDVALVSRLRGKATVAEHFVLERPGPWWVDLAPGCYGVGAFADLDRNYRYDDEPAVTAVSGPERLLELSPGEVVEEVDLVIDPDGRLAHGLDPRAEQLRAAELRSHGEQMLVSVSQVSVEGEVVSLPDARFGKESGRLGYFEIYRFLWEVGPGIYFLEEYDPDRIPVLFVHGALGYPQEFEALIGALDRSRFQPWVAFYPSGADLAAVSEYFSRTVSSLRLRLGFDALAVVAHSMGGLVARDLILRHHETSAHDPFVLLVSISTPWGGMPSARAGSEHSPFVVPSWRDVRPDSPFLSGLFYLGEDGGPRRRLPDRLGFHLLFGVADQTVPLPSAIRWEAVREARARWPLPYGHADVLRSPEAAELLVEILDGLR
jgi:pimeloyl-ACP methyl ester carboxylesterase